MTSDEMNELAWLLDSYESYLMACEHEYGGPKTEYERDLERAKTILERAAAK